MDIQRIYKKGDLVRVWSLQSFNGGGFINGREGRVFQDQTGDAVIVSVSRKINGKDQIDLSYEVYPQQLEFVAAGNENGFDEQVVQDMGELKNRIVELEAKLNRMQ